MDENQKLIPIASMPLEMDYKAKTESSLKSTSQGEHKLSKHVIEVKSRAQGIVLNVSFAAIDKVKVKLISTDLPDTVFYELNGRTLQLLLSQRYGSLASNANLFAVIPFATSGNLLLNEDSYIEVSLELNQEYLLKYDKVVTSSYANNPLVIKTHSDKEFESLKYDEMYFVELDSITDLRYQYAGQGISIPQFMYRNQFAIDGFASQKLIPDTLYTLSQLTSVYLVEY